MIKEGSSIEKRLAVFSCAVSVTGGIMYVFCSGGSNIGSRHTGWREAIAKPLPYEGSTSLGKEGAVAGYPSGK